VVQAGPTSLARRRHQVGVRIAKAIFSGGQCETSVRLRVSALACVATSCPMWNSWMVFQVARASSFGPMSRHGTAYQRLADLDVDVWTDRAR
jgi:hypothetical protein